MKCSKLLAIVSVLAMLGVSLPAVVRDQSAAVAVAVVGESEPRPLRVPDGFFTENAGQVPNEQVRFYSSGDMQAGFAESAVLIKLVERDHTHSLRAFEDRMGGMQIQPDEIPASRGVMVRITFPGSNRVMPQGSQEMPHRSNYFIGNDPSGWRTGVRSYREIVYRDLYDGIDLSYRTQDGQLKYEFIVDSGADPAIIEVSYEGVEGLRLDPSGELVVSTALGEVRDGKPIAYQDGRSVECAFVQRGPLLIGFRCEGRDSSSPLVIDPIVYSTLLGGGNNDIGIGIAVDSNGSAYVTGYTGSPDFPTTPGSFDTTFNGMWGDDVFVAKLNATGSGLVFATFLGGTGDDSGIDVAVDSNGSAYVTGSAAFLDFPTTPGSFDTTFNGMWGGDAFVAKLNATGSGLVYSTFLGGGDRNVGLGIAVDSFGSAYVTGETNSSDFPTTPGSFDTIFNGAGTYDAFVAKLNAAGSALVFATLLGGGNNDFGPGIAVDSFGCAYVTGYTYSTDFPATPGSFDTTFNGGLDAFVAKLNATGTALVYATFLGGVSFEDAWGIAVDSSGSAHVIGETRSADFPVTPGSFDTTLGGAGTYDAFVARLNAAGSALVYSTFLGGSKNEHGYGIATDSNDSAYVTGMSESVDFPTTPGSFDTTYNGGFYDSFVAKLNAAGTALVYSTFLGGSSYDRGNDISVDSNDSAYVTGETGSADFPATPGSFNTTLAGGSDAFVAKLDFSAAPVLNATGEPNYMSDGLDPETGTLAAPYTYRVSYMDADNVPPFAGEPKVHILKGGVEIAGSPFAMTAVDPADTTYTDGKRYTYSATLALRGTDYTYYFSASDDTGSAAMDWPNPPADAPDVLNRAPTADAGPDQSGLFRGYVVNLDGTRSTDPDGDPLTFSWTRTAGPIIVLTGGNTATPSFTPTAAGTYTFELTVDDGFAGGTDVDSVTVTVINRPPVADAGGPYTCRAGETIILNGSGSTDPDGDILTYQWTIHLTPVVTLSGQTPTHTCPATEGMFTVSLNVTDTGSLSDTDDAQMSVQPAGGAAADSTWLIVVLAVIAVVAVLVILFLLLRRKKRGEETQEPGESPPKSTS